MRLAPNIRSVLIEGSLVYRYRNYENWQRFGYILVMQSTSAYACIFIPFRIHYESNKYRQSHNYFPRQRNWFASWLEITDLDLLSQQSQPNRFFIEKFWRHWWLVAFSHTKFSVSVWANIPDYNTHMIFIAFCVLLAWRIFRCHTHSLSIISFLCN